MPCFEPLKGFRSKEINPKTGKRSIVFNRSRGYVDQPVTVPCGQCIGCRLERSRQWAVRCNHEASLHARNIFVTLTYDDAHLPEDRSLRYPDFQAFNKRLLTHVERHQGYRGVRFYMCGEYGEQFGRPHYHVCYFNLDMPDKKLWKIERGNPLYTSAVLTDIWGQGHTSIGAVTFQSAAYVARYIMKKVTGDAAADHYEWIDPETGEIHDRRPEFTNMSRRPGIAKGWFDQFITDVYPDDFVVVNGIRCSPPRYYANQYELIYPNEAARLKARRRRRALTRAADNTPDRLRVRKTVLEARIKRLKRTIE